MAQTSFRWIRLSLFSKCLAMVALLSVLVAGIITYNAAGLLRSVAMDGLRALAFDSSRSIAREVSGAIKFGKVDLIAAAFTGLEARAADKLTLAIAFDKSAEEKSRTGDINDVAFQQAATLARKALSTGQIEQEQDGLLIAAPAPFGEKGEIAGVIVTQWSSLMLEADYRAQLMRIVWRAVIVLGVLLVLAAWFLHRTLTMPLKSITRLSRRVADGNLAQVDAVPGTDEIAQLQQAASHMVGRLRDVVGNVASAITGVSDGSSAIADSSGQLSHSAVVQAAATEQVSTAIEQMSANIRQSADNASQTEKIAAQSAQDARESGKAVAEVLDAMTRIFDHISVVQEIARQTDLLALNAAVESARAGENGRGFAVVAAEVRKLAEKSRSAAGEISQLSAQTLRVARGASDMLGRLVPAIERTSDLVSGMSANTRELSLGTSQIASAIQRLDTVTQQNTAESESLSSSAVELSAQADQVRDAISYFRLDQTEDHVEIRPDVVAATRVLSAT